MKNRQHRPHIEAPKTLIPLITQLRYENNFVTSSREKSELILNSFFVKQYCLPKISSLLPPIDDIVNIILNLDPIKVPEQDNNSVHILKICFNRVLLKPSPNH